MNLTCKFYTILFACFSLTFPASGLAQTNFPVARMIGGAKLNSDKSIYAIIRSSASGINSKFFCSGILVGPRQVLTAAHCFYDPRTKAFVPPASIEIFVDNKTFLASNLYTHPQYNNAGRSNDKNEVFDLAVITLDNVVDTVVPAVIAKKQQVKKGITGTVYGYGLLEKNDPYDGTLPSLLKAGRYGKFTVTKVKNGIFETSYTKHKTAICEGDSGAGFVVSQKSQKVVLGIALTSNETGETTISRNGYNSYYCNFVKAGKSGFSDLSGSVAQEFLSNIPEILFAQ